MINSLVYKAVRDSIRVPAWDSVEDSVEGAVCVFVWYPKRGSVESDVNDSIKDFVRESAKDYFQTNSNIINQ
jgi:hypothetical protein